MSIVLTQAALDELDKHAPNYVRSAVIIKNHFDENNRVELDITDDVVSFGALVSRSTLTGVDWEKPSLTMIVKNKANALNKHSSSSFFNASPVRDPKECVLLMKLFIVTDASGTQELAKMYRGRIESAELKLDEDLTVVEIVTVMEQSKGMSKTLTKKEGGRLVLPHGALSGSGVP